MKKATVEIVHPLVTPGLGNAAFVHLAEEATDQIVARRAFVWSAAAVFVALGSFSLKGNYDVVKKFLPRLKLVHLAASLGSVNTLAGPPRTTSHVELSEAQRKLLGIPESLIRYSVGIENVEDLMNDLGSALDAL